MLELKKKSVAMVIILSLITCGLYLFYWIYDTTRETNQYNETTFIEPGIAVLLSIITCGIYIYVWMFQMGRHIMVSQRKAGIPESDYSVMYLLLSIFGFCVVAMALMQNSLNEVWDNA